MWRNRGKVIPILVAGMLTFSLAACGSSGQAADPSGGGQAPEAAAASETGAPEAEAAAEEEAAPAEEADTAAGRKIGFVGVTTPTTIRSSTPAYFQDENGEYVYSFKQDDTGEELYQAVQEAADAARADGAEYVYLVAHLGNEEACRPWNYVDVVSHTSGIDVVLDGHSHDTDQVVLKNKNGEDVTRSAVGTKMSCIGYSHISAEGEIVETDIWSWPNSDPAPELLGIHNKMGDLVEEAQVQLGKKLDEVVASTEVALQNLFEKELPLVREINPHIISGPPSPINSAVNMEGGAGQYRENDTD